MEIDISDSLDDLGYNGPLLKDELLIDAIDLGVESIEFTNLVSWLSKRLQLLYELEDFINPIKGSHEIQSFLVEVSSFLREIYCPYENLFDGPLENRLSDRRNRVHLLDFLCSELQAASIIKAKEEQKLKTLATKRNENDPSHIIQLLMDSFMVDASSSENAIDLFTNLYLKVNEKISSSPKFLQLPVLKEELSDEQWEEFEVIRKDLHEEYGVRRNMLLTRLDVTIQSFSWGESAKGKEDKIAAAFSPKRRHLKIEPSVDISDLIAAREDITKIEKTSSSNLVKNTKSAINRIVIEQVPDRGGRPREQGPPVEESGWSRRNPSNSSQGSGQWNKQHSGGYGGRGKHNKGKGKGGGDFHGKRRH